jgi:hypothetical protein
MESQEKEPLNKLHQKIFDELDRFEKFSTYITKQDAARIAAKICLEVGFKAFKAGNGFYDLTEDEYVKYFEDFKKEIL